MAHPTVCKVRFKDGHEVTLPETSYPKVKEKIASKDFDFDHNGELLNLGSYEHVFLSSEVSDIDQHIESQEPYIKEKLLLIKKYRERHYPYKPPFASIDHLNIFIEDIKAGKL